MKISHLRSSSYNVCLLSISSYPTKLHIRVQDSEIQMYIVDERKTNLRLPSGYSEVVNRTTTDEQLPKDKGHTMSYITRHRRLKIDQKHVVN